MTSLRALLFFPSFALGQINTETSPGTPMPAQEAADTLVLPKGFRATVFAAEPDVQNPIAVTWDAKARLWIAENYTYERLADVDLPKDLHDRILIFDDTDGDGKQDSRKVFADNLENLTSIEWSPKGIYAMCPPRLIFIPDANQDDVPDGPPITILNGFEMPESNHHNFANGLRWGPDGWLYGRCGASAPGRIGAPESSEEDRIPVSGTIWRYHPESKIYESLAQGATNPWGHDWDEDGNLFFINTVNGHFFHLIPGAHYTRSHTIDLNPYTYESIDFHADHWHFDATGSWQESRSGSANDFGGGHAHIGFNIYQGTTFPTYYQGKALFINMHGKRINVENIEKQGSGFVAKHEPDFLVSKDPFFIGMDLTTGPDGNMYLLDWSDTGECHEQTGVHRQSGRIFKISYGESNCDNPQLDMGSLSPKELEDSLKHPNIWQRRMATLLLHQNHSIKPPPSDALAEKFSATLDTVDGKIRATEKIPDLENFLGTLDHATNPATRLKLASGMQRSIAEDRLKIASILLRHEDDASDHNLPLMLWYGLMPLASSHPNELAALAAESKIPKVTQLITRRLCEELLTSPGPLNQLLVQTTEAASDLKVAILKGLSDATNAWQSADAPDAWEAFSKSLRDSPADDSKEHLAALDILFGDGKALDEITALVKDIRAPLEDRRAALSTLIRAQHSDLKEIALGLLDTRFLNLTAAQAMIRFDDAAAAEAVVSKFKMFHAADQPSLLQSLTTQPTYALVLLSALQNGEINSTLLTPTHVRQLLSLGNLEIEQKTQAIFGQLRESSQDKKDLINTLKEALTPDKLATADLALGAELYAINCAACHKLKGQGGEIGPDLTGSGRTNLDYLLHNIIDPSAEVSPDFLISILSLNDGRTLVGTIKRETDEALTVQLSNETITLRKNEIKSRQANAQSLMPEGILQSLSPEQQKDLLGYLMVP